jgi:flagellar protein FliS
MTLTRGELVVRLFEEASKQVSVAIFLADQNSVRSFNSVMKAKRIISALNSSLDMDQPISADLRTMYNFISEKLLEANASKDIELMKQMLSLIDDLKASFKQADKLARAQGVR